MNIKRQLVPLEQHQPMATTVLELCHGMCCGSDKAKLDSGCCGTSILVVPFTRIRRTVKPQCSGHIPACVITFCLPYISPAAVIVLHFLPKLLCGIALCY